ncbi:MAG: hypothetical protein ACLFU8_13690 [Anaerolineales bacterium]
MVPYNTKISRWVRVLILCALALLAFACLSTEEATAPEWEVRQGEGFSFAYPPDWEFNELDAPEPGEAYTLFMPDQEAGTNIVVLRNPNPLEGPSDLEEKMVAGLENSAGFTLAGSPEVERIPVAGGEGVKIRYAAEAGAGGKRLEGYQVGTLLPDGQAVAVTMSVFDEAHQEDAEAVFEQVVESLEVLK